MGMNFSECLNKGNEYFFELFSSFSVSKDEHDQIVNKYTDYIKGHAVDSSDVSDPGALIYGTLLAFSDEEISDALNDKKSPYSVIKRAIFMCERQKRILDVFKRNKWEKIDLTNSNLDKCIEKLTKREEAVSLTEKIVEADKELTDLIRMAQLEHSIAICNRALDTANEMFSDIAVCKEKRTAVPKIVNKDEEKVKNKIISIKNELEEIEKLHKKMFDNDLKLSNMEPLIKSPSAQWDDIISVCKKQIKNMNELQTKSWPMPPLKVQNVKAVQEILSHYKNMMELDEEICSMRNNISGDAQYGVFASKCKIQIENIKRCKSMSVQTPGIKVQNPNELLKTVTKEQEEKQRAEIARKKARFVKWEIIAVLIVVAIGIVFYLRTLVRTPYDSEDVYGEKLEDVCEAFEKAGFKDIELIADDSGWYEDETVLEVSINGETEYNKGSFKKPSADVVITYASSGRIAVSDYLNDWEKTTASDMVDLLRQNGFKNTIKTETVTFDETKDGFISSIKVNGLDYKNEECYIPADAQIEITYFEYQIIIGADTEDYVGLDYSEVVSDLQDKGFTNVTALEDADGWAKGNSVIEVLVNGDKDYSEDDSFVPGEIITVKYSSNDRLDAASVLSNWSEISYTQVQSLLMARGFTNISFETIETENQADNHTVNSISIKGQVYSSGDCYVQSDADIVVSYYVLYSTIDNEASTYIDREYTEVVDELKEAGFTNIQLQRGDNLITGWVTSEGTIRSITVDGNSDFAAGDSFAYDIPIIIVVNTFAGSGCEDITVIAE